MHQDSVQFILGHPLLKTTRSATVLVLLPIMCSSYSPLSIDMISSAKLNIYMKIQNYILDQPLYTDKS